jgi:hypothetical protein
MSWPTRSAAAGFVLACLRGASRENWRCMSDGEHFSGCGSATLWAYDPYHAVCRIWSFVAMTLRTRNDVS